MGDFKYLASLACTGLNAGLMLLVLMAGLLLGVNQLENLSCLTAFLANFKDRLYLLSDNVRRSICFRAFLAPTELKKCTIPFVRRSWS